MNDIKKIRFQVIEDGSVDIIAVINDSDILKKEVRIGNIFSDGSYSGKNSIQICGFDQMKGLWSCGRFNHSQDCCLVWNDIEQWLKTKSTETTGESNG